MLIMCKRSIGRKTENGRVKKMVTEVAQYIQ